MNSPKAAVAGGLMLELRSQLRLPKTIRCMLAYRCSLQPYRDSFFGLQFSLCAISPMLMLGIQAVTACDLSSL